MGEIGDGADFLGRIDRSVFGRVRHGNDSRIQFPILFVSGFQIQQTHLSVPRRDDYVLVPREFPVVRFLVDFDVRRIGANDRLVFLREMVENTDVRGSSRKSKEWLDILTERFPNGCIGTFGKDIVPVREDMAGVYGFHRPENRRIYSGIVVGREAFENDRGFHIWKS